MKKWWKRILWVAIAAAAVVVMRWTVLAPKPVPVSVHVVNRGKVEETVTNSKAGTVKVRQRSSLSPEIGGRVSFIGAREGERVTAGAVLLRLDDSEYRANLELSGRAVESARAAMREACVSAELAQRDFERNKTLSGQGIVSDEILDRASNQWKVAIARCEAAQAEVRRSQAAVEMAKANLQKTVLRAPFGGLVVELSTEVGEWVTPSPPGVPIPPVIDLLDDESVYVEAPMDETDTGRLHKGLPVRISLDPFPDRTFPGTLTRVGSFVQDIQGQNRTVDVEAEFRDPEFARTLLAGTSADVEVILQARENVLRIPTYALLEGGKVFLAVSEKLVTRPGKTGLRNWDFVEVQEGLKEGDRVVVTLDRTDVKEGVLITVREEVER